MPPYCDICSYHQLTPEDKAPVYHRHFSSREMRIVQGSEWSVSNRSYLCPTCFDYHPVRPDSGLNICLSDSQLHEFHHPRDAGVICPPDSLHIDWVTIPDATIEGLEYAWCMDYEKCVRPMRFLLAAGIIDLLEGGNFETVTNRILQMKNTIEENNKFHPAMPNEFVVATILNPPKLVWFADNGTAPHGHVNRLEEIMAINRWITEFNDSYGQLTPRFHRYGVKRGKYLSNGVPVGYTIHQLSQWKQSEPMKDKLHLSDYWRIRLGGAVIHHFQAEIAKRGVLL